MERKTLLIRMNNLEDNLCGFVYDLTESQIKYLKNIGEYQGRYYVELMSDGEMLTYENFVDYEKAVNQVINFVSCMEWKKDRSNMTWEQTALDILRQRSIA